LSELDDILTKWFPTQWDPGIMTSLMMSVITLKQSVTARHREHTGGYFMRFFCATLFQLHLQNLNQSKNDT